MTTFNEQLYEDAVVSLLQNAGWTHTPGDTLHRSAREVLLEDDLKAFFAQRYKEENLTENEIEKNIIQIKHLSNTSLFSANREAFRLVSEEFYLRRDDATQPNLLLSYIDFEIPENNIFRCVTQFTVKQHAERRPDILLFVNGIPLTIIELKNPANEETTIEDAWNQIHHRYKRDIPVLMRYCCLSIIADGANARLGTIFTPYEHYYAWKKVENEEQTAVGFHEIETLVSGALAPARFLEILRDFVYYPDPSLAKELQVVCRYPQFFATRKLYNNIRRHLKSVGGDEKGGTYFGATGCGKTFTMLFYQNGYPPEWDNEVFTQVLEQAENFKRYSE